MLYSQVYIDFHFLALIYNHIIWLSYFQTESSHDTNDAESSDGLEDDDLEPFDADDIVPEQEPVQVIEKPDRHPLCKDVSRADLEPFLNYIS